MGAYVTLDLLSQFILSALLKLSYRVLFDQRLARLTYFFLLCISALVVRFVTGRFLNEYDPTLGKEEVYLQQFVLRRKINLGPSVDIEMQCNRKGGISLSCRLI